MISGNSNPMTMLAKKTRRQGLWIFIPVAVIVFLILYRIFFYTSTEALSLKTVRVSGGWGYQVYVHDKLFIDQPFIPSVPGKKPFPDRKSALRVAKTIKAKLLSGQRPIITYEEISNAGIDSLGNLK